MRRITGLLFALMLGIACLLVPTARAEDTLRFSELDAWFAANYPTETELRDAIAGGNPTDEVDLAVTPGQVWLGFAALSGDAETKAVTGFSWADWLEGGTVRTLTRAQLRMWIDAWQDRAPATEAAPNGGGGGGEDTNYPEPVHDPAPYTRPVLEELSKELNHTLPPGRCYYVTSQGGGQYGSTGCLTEAEIVDYGVLSSEELERAKQGAIGRPDETCRRVPVEGSVPPRKERVCEPIVTTIVLR